MFYHKIQFKRVFSYLKHPVELEFNHMPFENKVVWITGASSGIGEALTYALHRKGARLILSSRRKDVLQKVKENCPGDPSDIHIIPLDLAETDSLNDKAR